MGFAQAADGIRTTVSSYSQGSGSLVTTGIPSGTPTPSTSSPVLLTVVSLSTYATYPETWGTYLCTGTTGATLTGLTLIDGTDSAWASGDIVEMRTCAKHLNDLSSALGTSLLTVSAESSLPGSRQLTAGSGVTLTDNGAGSTLVIAATGGGGGGSGTVTTMSVVSANGFAGTVANASTTPAVTLTTSVTGILKGSSGAIVAATSGTDYVTPSVTTLSSLAIAETQVTGLSSALSTLTSGIASLNADIPWAVPNGGTGVQSLSPHGVVLSEGTAAFSVATIGTAGRMLIDQGSGVDPAFEAMSGDATLSSSGVITIGANKVTLAKMATLAAYSVIANATGSAATPTAAQTLTLGTPSITDTGVLLQSTAATNGYEQVILQNTSNGSSASTDYVVNNDQGTSSTHYGDFGINSSAFSGSGSFNLAGATYLYAASGDLAVGTFTANGIHFVVNNGTTDALTINTSSQLVVPAFGAGYVGSNGSGVLSVSAVPNIQVFTGSGTYTVPANATFVRVLATGSGGGGGGGGVAASGTAVFGGGGGGGGSFVDATFLVSDLSSPVTITIGAAGSAGNPGATGGGSGGAGGGINSTSFGSYCVASGGHGGGGGSTSSGAAGVASSGWVSGAAGGASSTSATAASAVTQSTGICPGGGAGGGISASPAAFAGGAGGGTGGYTVMGSSSGGAIGGATGTSGISSPASHSASPGTGGGGGGGSITASTPGGPGGSGGTYGAGGGGGGAALTGQGGGGTGGTGGPAVMIILAW